MTRIYLFLNDDSYPGMKNYLSDYDLMCADGTFEDILTQICNFSPDVVLIDNSVENPAFSIRQIKSATKSNNSQIILLLDGSIDSPFMELADGLVEYPVKKDVLLSTINSHLKIKKSLDRLYENNKELSKSLYQLNVLYNTSSQFAGTLNTGKLYDIMTEAMEKTLSFDICSALIFNSQGKPQINLNTIHTPSDSLLNALKIRTVLSYKTVVNEHEFPSNKDFEFINVIQKIKQTRSNRVYGLESLSYDSLFAPIKVGDDFFGAVELFRQTPFLPEDVTCFQAITHQVALPLRSAKLYEDITVTNKKLEKLEKLKSDFVSIVSHELRTPLTPINNSLQIILAGQAGEITPDTRNFLSMIKRNIHRLSEIIEDLLDLSRIQTGKLDFKYNLVNVVPSLELMQKTFLQVANDKNIKINLDIVDTPPEIYADRRRLEQIFTNLVSNSLKFTPQDGEINITLKVIDGVEVDNSKLIMPKIKPEGQYVKISVADNGVGIKKEDIPRIFDKFSQIESSLNRNRGGIGLGLTITKQLVDSHLGAIWVDSVEKEGSTFNVILPFANDLNKFLMDLSQTLINNPQTGILGIKFDSAINLIDELKLNKLLVMTKTSKELLLEFGTYDEYFIFIPKITRSSFDALYNTLKEYCRKNFMNMYGIMLENMYCDSNCDVIEVFQTIKSKLEDE